MNSFRLNPAINCRAAHTRGALRNVNANMLGFLAALSAKQNGHTASLTDTLKYCQYIGYHKS